MLKENEINKYQYPGVYCLADAQKEYERLLKADDLGGETEKKLLAAWPNADSLWKFDPKRQILNYLKGQLHAALSDQTSWLWKIKDSSELKRTQETAEYILENLTVDPIAIQLQCPRCGEYHIDEGEYATKPHKVHSCQRCGLNWKPSLHSTVGVEFLPGTKN